MTWWNAKCDSAKFQQFFLQQQKRDYLNKNHQNSEMSSDIFSPERIIKFPTQQYLIYDFALVEHVSNFN